MKNLYVFAWVFLLYLSSSAQTISNFSSYDYSQNLPNNIIEDISGDPSGKVCFAGPNELYYFESDSFFEEQFLLHDYFTNLSLKFDYDPSGILYIPFKDSLYTIENGVISSLGNISTMFQIYSDVLVDFNNQVWFCNGHDIFKYDGNNIQSISITPAIPYSNPKYLFQSSNGDIYVSIGNGVAIYDGGNWTYMDVTWGGNQYGVTAIGEDQNGIIWFGKKNIASWDGQSLTYFNISTVLNISFTLEDVTAISLDEMGNIWFGTSESGLFYQDVNGNWFLDNIEENQRHVRSMYLDANGCLWVGFYQEGLAKLKSGLWTRFNGSNRLVSNVIIDIYEGSDSSLFFTTSDGVTRFDGTNWATNFNTFGSNYSNVCKSDIDGNTINVGDDFYSFNGTAWDTIDAAYQTFNDILTIGYDDFWFVGIKVYHMAGTPYWLTGNWTEYNTSNGVPGFPVQAIEKDSSQTIWTGGVNGIAYFNGVDFTPVSMPVEVGTYVLDIRTDLLGRLWIGTNDGVACKDNNNWTSYHELDGLSNNYIERIEIASDSSIWFATRNGVSRYKDGVFTNTYESDGLIHWHCHSIEQDHEGNMWVGTHHGISKIHNAVNLWQDTLSVNHFKPGLTFNIYPNPANNEIFIKEIKVNSTIEIYSLLGELIITTHSESKEMQINISDFKIGTYVVHVHNEAGSCSRIFEIFR